MMQVYLDALRKSASGVPCYVFSKSLDIVRTSDPHSALKYLNDDWKLGAYCVNNVMTEKFITDDSNKIMYVLDFLGVVSEETPSELCLTYETKFDTLQRRQSVTLTVDTLLPTSQQSSGIRITYTDEEGMGKADYLRGNMIFALGGFTNGEEELKAQLMQKKEEN